MGAKKILVVDFDQEFLKFLSQFLRNEGFAVVTATDGFAGLEMHKSESPDLVITEAMLPKLHGFELCSRISHSASRKTPVVIVTGVYRDTVYKTEALHTFGAAAYFEKPLDPEELMVSLRKILGLADPKDMPEDPIDAAIMEALVSKKAASPAPVKPAAKASSGDEIDNMLRSTLAEFGLKPEKRQAPGAAPAPKPQTPSSAAALSAKPGAPVTVEPKPERAPNPASPARPSAGPQPPALQPSPKTSPARSEMPRQERPPVPQKPEIPSEKPVAATRPGPAVPVPTEPRAWAPHAVAGPSSVEKPKPFEPVPVFGRYSENKESKKKNLPPRLFGAVAGVLVLTSATVFVLKPGKGRLPAENAVPSVVVAATGSMVGGIGPDAGPAPSAAAPVTVNKKKNPKPAPPAAEDKPLPEPEEIKPLAPETNPSLEIQTPEATAPAPDIAPADAGAGNAAATEAPVEIPAAKVKAGDLIPLGEADVPPRQITTADPVYPNVARNLRKEGAIMINVLISETGDVIQTAVIGGNRGSLGFDKAAENAVRKWKFSPAEKNGVPVRVWKSVTIAFKLK
jgi:TonB family protein